ncbi:MAG: sensor histidine kinase [Gaiellales bacterium]
MLSFIAAAAWGSLIMPIIAYVLATHEWYVAERTRLIELAAKKEAARMRAVGALDALRDVALVAVQRDVESARTALDRDDLQPDEVATALLAAARTTIRPAAHLLMERPARALPRVSIGAALRSELRNHPLPVRLPAVLFPLLIIPRVYFNNGAIGAIVAATTGLVAILTFFPIGRQLIERYPARAITLTLATAAAAALTVVTVLGAAFEVREPLVIWVLITVIVFALVVVTKMTRVVDLGSATALRDLQEPIRQAEFERLAAEQARELILREIGTHLHSSVQPGLVAASYAIQDAVEREDPIALETAINLARTALAQRMGPEPKGPTGDMREQIAAEWRGLLRLEWAVDGDDIPTNPRITDTIRECLSNAVVHGHARAATIRLTRTGADIAIEIQDDGIGPQRGTPGMGSAVLHESTDGRWRIDHGSPSGTIVRARVSTP